MKLIQPTTVGVLSVPNRVVMAPMTRNRAEGTIPNSLMATYYRQRASAAFIITEATQVDPMGQGYPNTPGIHTEEQAEGWRGVTDAVHAAGGRIVLQLWHVGRISHSSYHKGALPVSSSSIAPEGQTLSANFEMVPFEIPRALDTSELPEIVAQYRRGAELAKKAGFDGVEVHGANGYLLDQFLQSGTNQRTDAYGGSLENRAKLLLEVVDTVVDVWGADRVGIRLSPASTFNSMSDEDPVTTFTYVTEQLSVRRLAYLHVVDGELPNGRTAGATLRDAFDGPLIVAGGYDREQGEQTLADGTADLIAYARFFLANPDLPRRFAEDAPLNEWNEDTFYQGGEKGYIDYPALDEVEA